MNYYIRVRTKEQLQQAAVCLPREAEVTFMLPVDMEHTEVNIAAGHPIVASLPFIARENTMRKLLSCVGEANWAEGFVIANVDELGLLESMNYKGKVIADSFLYAANGQAMEMYREHFPEMIFMASDELTDEEIFRMKDARKLIYKIYGRARLMITAQSLKENFTEGSKKHSSADREEEIGQDQNTVMIESLKHDRFVCADESFGYSVLYTKDPVSMLDKMDEIKCESLLVDFTLEGKKEVAEVMNVLFNGGELENIRFGRGHHYKGID